MGAAVRATGRAAGSTWRLMWWVIFPPLGAYLSWAAGRRRRHNQLIRTIRESPR